MAAIFARMARSYNASVDVARPLRSPLQADDFPDESGPASDLAVGLQKAPEAADRFLEVGHERQRHDAEVIGSG